MKGGKRTGAGRKQGYAAKSAEEARHILSEMVMQEIEPIGRALIAKAKNGEISAIRELFDRAWGRSPQAVNLTTESKTGAEAGEYSETLLQAGRLADNFLKARLYDMPNA